LAPFYKGLFFYLFSVHNGGMLYVVYGVETDKARAKKDSLVASCKKQKPDAEFFVIDGDNFSERALEELYSSQGLFVKKHIVVLDRLLLPKKPKEDGNEVKDITKDTLLASFPKMAESESVFILFNELFDAKTLAQVKKHAKDIFVFGEKKIAKEKDTSTFSIVDAYAMKEKKSAWVNYQKCIRAGIAPEAIHGALFWKMKTLLLEKKERKDGRFSKNFTESELNEILTELNKIYHGIRSDGGEMEVELEKFLLK
jgi:DNA polymerase III delta subunit